MPVKQQKNYWNILIFLFSGVRLFELARSPLRALHFSRFSLSPQMLEFFLHFWTGFFSFQCSDPFLLAKAFVPNWGFGAWFCDDCVCCSVLPFGSDVDDHLMEMEQYKVLALGFVSLILLVRPLWLVSANMEGVLRVCFSTNCSTSSLPPSSGACEFYLFLQNYFILLNVEMPSFFSTPYCFLCIWILGICLNLFFWLSYFLGLFL